MSKFSLISFIIALILVLSYFIGVSLPYPSNNFSKIDFSIRKGENVSQIANNLSLKKIIFSPYLFRFYLKVNNLEKNIKAGDFEINLPISIKKLAEIITSNHLNNIFLIKEGDTLKEIEKNLKEKEILKEEDSIEKFTLKDFKDFALKINLENYLDKPLEGFLFPDSYHLPKGLSSKEIVQIFLNNFLNKINPEILEETKKQNKNFYEVLTLASIIEKEVKDYKDKQMVIDILLKRLKENIPLQVDATICYALNKSFSDCHLTYESLKIDSLYNTYLYKGLPPTPISNPSLESIKAVLNPLANDYWYYLTNRKTGETIFSKTYEEHLKAREKYL